MAFLGASPEQCVKTYGEPTLEQDDDGGVTRIYKPSFSGFASAAVIATFYDNKVEYIQYTIPNQSRINRDQFALISMLNGDERTSQFNYAGQTPKKQQKIWSKDDSSAYLLMSNSEAELIAVDRKWMIRFARSLDIVPDAQDTPPTGEAKSDATPYSCDWLKKGCTSIIVFKQQRDSWTDEQESLFFQVTSWMNGFMVGANAMGLASNQSKLFYPPDKWLFPDIIAPRILAFIDEHEGMISEKTPARIVMLAWYYSDHPDSTESERALAMGLLEDSMQP